MSVKFLLSVLILTILFGFVNEDLRITAESIKTVTKRNGPRIYDFKLKFHSNEDIELKVKFCFEQKKKICCLKTIKLITN